MDVREKLVELLKNAKSAMKSEKLSCDIARNMFVVDFMMANGVTVQEWISVDDRLPEDSGYYLVVYRDKYNGSISIAFDMYVKCNVGEWWESEFACDITKQFLWATRLQEQEVTHWMSLPQPPKGE